MKTITFLNIGRDKRCFAEVVPFATCDVIAKLAKKRGRLRSKCVEAIYNEDGNGGSILAGMHRVGTFTVLP